MPCPQDLFATVFVFGAAICAHAQAPDKPPIEEFDLNIVNERITEENFFRSKALDLANGDMRVHIGAAVSAAKIGVTLTGVTGHIRFRASLGLLERLFRSAPPVPEK